MTTKEQKIIKKFSNKIQPLGDSDIFTHQGWHEQYEIANGFYYNNLSLDAGTNTTLNIYKDDAGVGEIQFINGSTDAFNISSSGQETARFQNQISDADMTFNINDGGTNKNLITFDASEAAVGVGSNNTTPLWDLDVLQNTDALTGSSVDISELGLVVKQTTTTNGAFVGIGFENSAGLNIGAAIVHERTGTNSKGKLHFSTKTSTTSGANLDIMMTIDDAGNVGIGTKTPNASTLLELASTTKAFRPPRMTTAQRDLITGAEGMLIYNTTNNELDFYDTSWAAVLSNIVDADISSSAAIDYDKMENTSGLLGIKIIRKTADETVNNSSTMQDDDQLKLTLAANEIWEFETSFICDLKVTSDFKFQFSIPTSATLYYMRQDAGPTSTAWDETNTPSFSAATGKTLLRLKGIIINGANAGDLQFRWAQNIATVEDTSVLTNSILKCFRIL